MSLINGTISTIIAVGEVLTKEGKNWTKTNAVQTLRKMWILAAAAALISEQK